ncbi:BTAD domain-containing putative transcriptional regulator [Streptomyces sp. NPDC002889]|uniref:AfsR/SARP family transcriptional regulator n=1 Tax=Streptomyces sp. NPDC002889 TaxID=3364669 RepID=UPI003692CEDB
MKFSVLGPVRAWHGRTEVGLGSPQQKAVLVALLLRRGHPAAAGELVDALWGEHSPPGAVSVLRTYVSRLRKILEPNRAAGQRAGLVVSVADGYALRIAQTALDLGVFEQRMTRAKQLRAAGDLPEAGELLHIALDAWSGTPLAGIPGPLAEAERSRLAERRLNALETRIEVDLQMGQHAELVPELTVLCGNHPLRERLCELLMLALYRCGRQAEALEAYWATRRKLVAELGIEPGPALRETQRRLLAVDPALAAPGPATDLVTAVGPAPVAGGGAAFPVRPRAADQAPADADPDSGADSGAGPGTAAGADRGRTGSLEGARSGSPVPGAAVAEPYGADGDLARAGPGGLAAVADESAAAVVADPAGNPAPAGDNWGTGEKEHRGGAGHVERAASAAAPAAALPAAFEPLPSQLPADLPAFAGRLAELTRTRALLPEGATPSTVVISAIGGMAGVGKTTLAVHWAHEIAPRFPDGQLYINLRGFDPSGAAMDPAEAIRAFLGALGVPPQRFPAGLDAQAALYRSLLARRRVLIVLDNARDTEQVRPLLPGTAGCLVIVTSRNQLPGLVATEGAHPLTLDLLAPAEARELLTRRIGRARLEAEPEAVDEIVALCSGLPLTLAIVAARALTYPEFPLYAIAEELRESHGSLDAFAGTDAFTDARAIFSWSYHALPSAVARLFRLLALHPGPDITVAASAALAGLPLRETRSLLADLTRAHLLTQHLPGRYTFHDLLRAYAAEIADTLDTEAERHAALHRMLDHYLHTAHSVSTLLTPYRETISLPEARPGSAVQTFRDQKRAKAWLVTERRVLLAAVERAAEAGFAAHAWRLAFTLDLFFDRLGHWHDQFVIQRAALDAARSVQDRLGQAHAERALGFACFRLDRVQDAVRHLRNALDLFAALGDASGEARTHRSLAFLANGAERYHDAFDHYRQAGALYHAAGHRSGEANVCNEVGWTYILLGDHMKALTQCAQAIVLHQELGDLNGEAAAQDSLGYALHHLGEYDEAIDCFLRAVELYRELGDHYLEADTLSHIAGTRRAAGDRDAARTAWQQAVAILEEFDHPDAEQVRESLRRLEEEVKAVGRVPEPEPSVTVPDSGRSDTATEPPQLAVGP